MLYVLFTTSDYVLCMSLAFCVVCLCLLCFLLDSSLATTWQETGQTTCWTPINLKPNIPPFHFTMVCARSDCSCADAAQNADEVVQLSNRRGTKWILTHWVYLFSFEFFPTPYILSVWIACSVLWCLFPPSVFSLRRLISVQSVQFLALTHFSFMH